MLLQRAPPAEVGEDGSHHAHLLSYDRESAAALDLQVLKFSVKLVPRVGGWSEFSVSTD